MFKKLIPNYILKFLLKAGIFLLIYTLCRLVFLIANNNQFPVVYFTDFLAGIWFDMVTVAIVFLPLIALEVFPNKWRNLGIFKWVFLIAFHCCLFLTVLMNLIDVEYFKHSAARSTASLIEMLSFGDDLKQQLPVFLGGYWYLILILIGFQCLGGFLYNRVNRIEDDSRTTPWWKQIILFPIIAALFVIVGRGGIGLRPISTANAATYTIDQNIPLVLNSAFSIIKTWGNLQLEEKQYFDDVTLKTKFSALKHYDSEPILNQPNIVILLLESFSVEYISSINGTSEGYTPFLDSLIDSSLVFTNCYANGKKSMDAMPSVISSIPKLMEIEYLTSSYASNKIESLPKILGSLGYESGFFHGATNGSMNFDVFADVTGFDHYYGRTEYDNDADFDGTWGIYDEPFLKWSIDQITALKTPFFTTLFTISSHHPYSIPSQHQERFNLGPSEMHNAVSYADYALSQFFNKAKNQSWYDNTLFVIVADHTPASGTPIYFKDMGNMHIPLIFFHPSNSYFKGRNEKVVSQTDIMPSILQLMGYKQPFFAFGQSALDQSPGYSASCVGDKYLYFGSFQNEHYLLVYQNEQPLGLYNLKDQLQTKNLLEKVQLKGYLENQLKAMIQTYNHALISNEMTVQ